MSLLVQELNLSGGSLEKRPIPNIPPSPPVSTLLCCLIGETFYIRANEDLMRYRIVSSTKRPKFGASFFNLITPGVGGRMILSRRAPY